MYLEVTGKEPTTNCQDCTVMCEALYAALGDESAATRVYTSSRAIHVGPVRQGSTTRGEQRMRQLHEVWAGAVRFDHRLGPVMPIGAATSSTWQPRFKTAHQQSCAVARRSVRMAAGYHHHRLAVGFEGCACGGARVSKRPLVRFLVDLLAHLPRGT
jgi:hypothetical protein